MKCEICEKEFDTLRGFGLHLLYSHQLKLITYKLRYSDPKDLVCICGKPKRITRNTILVTCGNSKCKARPLSEEHKEKLRRARFEYLKINHDKTAWANQSKGQMSIGEKTVHRVFTENSFYDKYDIVRNHPVYPYFIDFAFINEKIAVEFDGAVHYRNGYTRVDHDLKKDEYLISKGWRIYRIPYFDINKFSILNLSNFIGVSEIKNYGNSLIEYRDILKEKELLKLEKHKISKLEKSELIESRLNDIKNLSKKARGWIGILSNKWGVSHTQVRRFILKYVK